MTEKQLGELAQGLYNGYLGYAGVAALVRHPCANNFVARLEIETSGPAPDPIEPIRRQDGSAAYFSLSHALRNVATAAPYQQVYDRLWLSGALLALGDGLSQASYLDRGPDLEFIRHLRNGIAHGNQFHFANREPCRPARFTGPEQRLVPDGRTTALGQAHTFEVTRKLQGKQVLFGFLGPGDVCDLPMSVESRLTRIGNGDPRQDLWPQHP